MKRGILLGVLLLVIINSGIVNADFLSINLSSNKVSQNQNFDGVLKFNFSSPVEVYKNITFNVDGVLYKKELIDVYGFLNKNNFLPEEIKKNGADTSELSITFNEAEKKVLAGIDLSSTGGDINQISKFVLGFKGEQFLDSFPTLKLDIGNDGIIDYIYLGSPLNTYTAMDSSYLGDNNPDQWKGIRGNNRDRYCQKISLIPCNEFKVSGVIKKIFDGAMLNATIKPFDETIPDIDDCSIDKCCIMTQEGSSFSCNIKYEINEIGDYSVCVSAFGPENQDEDKRYYELAADTGGIKGESFYNGGQSSVDHFITVSKRDFDATLKTQISKNFDEDGILAVTDYINRNDCSEKCIIPLAVSSESSGKIKINSLNLELEDSSGPSTLNKIIPIISLGKRANFSETFSVPLSFFNELAAPYNIGEGHKIYASINLDNILKSNEVNFEVIEGLPLSISLSSRKVSVGQAVYFTARIFQDYSGNIIYKWDFGDGKNSTGKEVSHSFNLSRIYTVSLTALSSSGEVSKTSISIDVRNISENINSRIDVLFSEIKSKRESFDSSSSQIKDTGALIGFSDKLIKLDSDLRALNASVNNILFNTNITSTEKEKRLIAPSNTLASLEGDLPLGISSDIISFPATITEISEIPSGIGNDKNKEAILIAQSIMEVNGEARKISVSYVNASKNENFIVIKKTISNGIGTIYEILPNSLTKKEIIIPKTGYEIISSSIIKFVGVDSFIYSVNENDIDEAVNTKTIIVPSDLGGGVNTPVNKPIIINIDNRTSLIWFLVPLLVVILILVYFSLYFKGGLMKNLGNSSVKKLFKNDNDYKSMMSFVLNSLEKGIKDNDIKMALKKKGWKDGQINYVINEVRKKRK